MWHMWEVSGGVGWWMVFGWLWTFIFWGGLIALIVWGIAKLTGRGSSISRRDLLYVAKERYAKGEISREEFDQMKKDLA